MASPSNSMNPFALTDEDEPSPRIQGSSDERETPDETTRKIGLTSHPESSVDGLPSQGTAYDSIFRDQSAEGRDGEEVQRSHHQSLSSSDQSKGPLANGSYDGFMPPDSEIPSLDTESSGRTAEQSMYLSLRPSSNGTSKRTSRKIYDAAGSTREGIDLGSSSQGRADVIETTSTDASRWKGKAKDMGNTAAESFERGRSTDPFMGDPPTRDNSASPPPDLLRSRSSSGSSSNHLSPNHRTRRSDDTFRDAAAEKRDLLPLPVTAVKGTSRRKQEPLQDFASRSMMRDIIFDAQDSDLRDSTPQSRKPKVEKQRHHHKRRHYRKHHSDRPPAADDPQTLDESAYPAEAYDDDPHAMLMSTRSTNNSSRTSGKRKRRSRKTVDPTAGLSERERAMWGWANVVDLDGYLQEVSFRISGSSSESP